MQKQTREAGAGHVNDHKSIFFVRRSHPQKGKQLMSVVVAIKKGGHIYMGCDSQVTTGRTCMTLRNPNNFKIWRVPGAESCLMGSVGDFRDACVIRTSRDLVSDYDIYRDHICYDFVVNEIVPAVINRLKEANYLKKEGVFECMNSCFLFAHGNQLFSIHNDGSVLEIEDYISIGSGKNEAAGNLLSSEREDPYVRIIKAIKASAATDIYVDYPIILSDTKGVDFHVITDKNEAAFIKARQTQAR